MINGPISQFITNHYKHFNAAALVDAAKAYQQHLDEGKQMLVSLAGAMSTAELGRSFAEMIRQDKVHIISCTGANLEEDLMNLVAHSHYERVPNYRDLTPSEEWDLLERGLNRVTDTCIPEEEAFRRLQGHVFEIWKSANYQIKHSDFELGGYQDRIFCGQRKRAVIPSSLLNKLASPRCNCMISRTKLSPKPVLLRPPSSVGREKNRSNACSVT